MKNILEALRVGRRNLSSHGTNSEENINKVESAIRQVETSEASKVVGARVLSPELTSLLEDLHKWFTEGPMDDWGKRVTYHMKLSEILGKPPTDYPSE
jgi:hypothetical protein